MDTTATWIHTDGLLLNTKKCECMSFSRTKPKNSDAEINLSIDKNIIPTVPQCKLLGVIIDKNLNFSEHVTHICGKTSKQISALKRFKKILGTETKMLLYKSYILPHFTYSSTVWIHCGKTNAAKLEKLNERALRCIFRDNTSTYDDILKKAKMTTLQNRRIQDMCILIYKTMHGLAPAFIRDMITVRDTTKYNLRGKTKLFIPRINTTKFGLNSFYYYGPKIWNSLKEPIRTAPSLDAFIHEIRNITFDTCDCHLCK